MSATGRTRHRDNRHRSLVARGILDQHGNLTDRGEQYAEEQYHRTWEPEFDEYDVDPEPYPGGMTV